jgi:hypothetical protein
MTKNFNNENEPQDINKFNKPFLTIDKTKGNITFKNSKNY